MKWQGRRGSRNIEDRRGMSGGRMAVGGGGIGVLLLVVVGALLGVDVRPFLDALGGGSGGGGGMTQSAPRELSPEDEQVGRFVSVTLADTEEVWAEVFDEQVDGAYRPVTLVLFSGATRSACGGATAQVGPFYCPVDRKAYLDTDFFRTLSQRLGARGDFAAAYVIAHEVAHHVQNELGILGQANQLRARVSERESNEISVRIELQADCYSGIWARRAEAQFGSIEPGDIEEAMNAAGQIGDDTLQRNAGQVVRPHTFTHGTSAQRQRWFARGYDTGDMMECDTFGADRL